ncbi:MAG: GH3 auxin-responsive promoter family protein [Saprospiraceae bacterium]|nr:GH3 auxin-responsive promoter family protein [Saprospiraceae bacterium]
MQGRLFNRLIATYLSFRHHNLEKAALNVPESQQLFLRQLLSEASHTTYGKKYGLDAIKTAKEFREILPLVRYEDIAADINSMMEGKPNVLWPGQIKYFAKSSGTTNHRSKFIPISNAYLRSNLIRSCWDTAAFIYNLDKEATVFLYKNLIMGGSLHAFPQNPDILVGDVSAIMIKTIPMVGRLIYTPDIETALLDNWIQKIEKICQQCIQEKVVMFGGVPTWNIVLFNRILEITGKQNILEVWPELKYYLHGGVNFEPYKETFRKFLPRDDFYYIEAYNASEGYFAVQDTPTGGGMRLLTDNGIYYEFIEPAALKDPDSHLKTLTLDEVGTDINYAMVITNNSGLWRYLLGDTVTFTSLKPFRIKVTGRIEQYINAFGEEVMIGNTDRALALTLEQFGLQVKEYTVAPRYLDGKKQGYHEWLIEFVQAPVNLSEFEEILDKNLREINSDYDAKRFKNLALQNLKIIAAPSGIFHLWLKKKNKIGGQYKVPRLSNDRHYFNEIMELQTRLENFGHE